MSSMGSLVASYLIVSPWLVMSVIIIRLRSISKLVNLKHLQIWLRYAFSKISFDFC